MSGEKKRPPGKRCVVMFCNKTNNDKVSLHQFPKEPTLRRQWISFVLTKRDDKTWTPGTGHICSSHFTEDDYESYGSKLAGFSTKLVLKKGSFPTVQPIPTTEQLVKAKNKRALQLRKRPCTSTRTNTKTSSSAPKRQSRALSKLTCNRVGIISHFKIVKHGVNILFVRPCECRRLLRNLQLLAEFDRVEDVDTVEDNERSDQRTERPADEISKIILPRKVDVGTQAHRERPHFRSKGTHILISCLLR